MITEAQQRANKKWHQKHRAEVRYIDTKSKAKHFILKMANTRDLEEMAKYISIRSNELSNKKSE